MSRLMIIGEAAEAAGVSAKMIRHYEQIGLMPAAHRTDSGYRQYTARDVSVLRFIRQSRRLGFSMEQIADLLGLWGNDRRTSREVKQVAQTHLSDLEQKMRELAEMQQALRKLVHACQGGEDPNCVILAELAVSSPEPPTHGAVATKISRKGRSQPAGAAPSRTAPAASSHLDLMAWTHSVHTASDHP